MPKDFRGTAATDAQQDSGALPERGWLDRFLTWTRLRRGLLYFGEPRFQAYLWIVPVIAIGLQLFNAASGAHMGMPELLTSVFMVALPFAGAHLLYIVFCPTSLKGMESADQWIEKTLTEKQRILELLKAEMQLRADLFEIVANWVDRITFERKIAGAFEQVEMQAMKTAFGMQFDDKLNPLGLYVEQLGRRTHRSFDILQYKVKSVRYLAGLFLALTIVGSTFEISERIWEVLKATFDVG